MTIALVAALAIREFFTALIILLFVLIAEMLEELTVDRGRHAIQTLLALLPKRATVRRDGDLVDLPIDEVKPGDIVAVKPGQEIAVDGTVTRGHSFVDQSSITGESVPAEKLLAERCSQARRIFQDPSKSTRPSWGVTLFSARSLKPSSAPNNRGHPSKRLPIGCRAIWSTLRSLPRCSRF